MIDENKLESRLIDEFNYSMQKRDYEFAVGNHSTGQFYRGYAKALSNALDTIREIKSK